MIHVNVIRDEYEGYRIETSIDGGPWTIQYFVERTLVNRHENSHEHAVSLARTFAKGARFAGAHVKITNCGFWI